MVMLTNNLGGTFFINIKKVILRCFTGEEVIQINYNYLDMAKKKNA